MRRLHWFWRSAIAVVSGSVSGGVLFCLLFVATKYWGLTPPGVAFMVIWLGAVLVIFVIPPVVGVAVYSILARRYGPQAWDGETRCRKCGYILRGIREPRCSECGEKI